MTESFECKYGTLVLNDCFDVFYEMEEKVIDMILCDLPYGTTQNKWDSVLDLDALWGAYKRLAKDNAAIVLFGQDKFTAKVVLSNEEMHRYNLVWDKVLVSGILNANRMPLRSHEDIMVFYKKPPVYNPQKTLGAKKNNSRGKMLTVKNSANYGAHKEVDNADKLGQMKHPRSILTFQKPHPSKNLHPTEKSVELCEFLIKTYTDENRIVMDNCAGSSPVAIACMNTNRKFLCIEKNKEYFDISKERIIKHIEQYEANQKNT